MRTFISVDIEKEEIVSQLSDFTRKIETTDADTNIVSPENFHITVKFLGEVRQERISEIVEVVKRYTEEVSPFTITLAKMGAFPSSQRPKVIWIGGEDDELLDEIATKISNELERRGFRKDKHPYHTHVTLARIDWYTDELKKLLSEYKDVKVGDLSVDHIRVKKSELSREGPTYITLHEVPL